MAIINLYTKEDESGEYNLEVINHDSNAVDWLVNNIETGRNFSVYSGQLSKEHEISRDFDKVYNADEVSVFLLPAGEYAAAAYYIISAVILVASLLIKPSALNNLNRTQQSPNNSLSDRNNKARPNQRIVDVCGQVKCIPDILSREYSRFVDNIEVRVGYYCVARNNLLIEDVKEGDTLISDIPGASAGVYGANKSPNNDSPDIQIGDPINEPVYGVTQSSDAIGQTLTAPNANKVDFIEGDTIHSDGYIESTNIDFTEKFSVGDNINLVDVYVRYTIPGHPVYHHIGFDTHLVTAVEANKITFDISGDPSWGDLNTGSSPIRTSDRSPYIEGTETILVGPFKMTSFKINRLIVNINALNGIYKENSGGRLKTSVEYTVSYQKLDDSGSPIGSFVPVAQVIDGNSSDEKGQTTEIDLGGATFVQWNVKRTSPLDFAFNGTVVDEIKVSSVFGLTNIENDHFGNVTTIQTKRTNKFLTTATKTPELNCIATELVQKYENGVFATQFTPNTQAMQSLIRLALDPHIGRRTAGELDLDLLVSLQSECESYFSSSRAGEFNYSFDSTALSAQETFLAIGKAAFITLWREGRVLKGWFESPQSIPSMVFTHRSKQAGNETWNRKRNTSDSKDSIEFVYTDDSTYAKETLFYPADKSGVNPERVEFTGVKGIEQATTHMMRLFNKRKYQEITVDFGATEEGRFVKPQSLISVVKGSRINTFDGNVTAVNGLLVTLSQDVEFTQGDSHSIIFKKRDGSTESILCFETEFKNVVNLIEAPTEELYTGNDALKTEFSFGNEARLTGQLMIAQEILPDNQYVNIKAINYSDLYYQNDTDAPGRAYSDGYSDGFS